MINFNGVWKILKYYKNTEQEESFMLKLENLHKNFGNKVVLDDINFEFTNGVYALLAPNGAGKSTLMKLITTLYRCSEGRITYNGVDIKDMGEDFRDLIGYLPQDFEGFKSYSPRRYLTYLAELKGVESKEIKSRVERLLQLVGLSNVANKKIGKFSGGMRRRVGIAQSLINDPKILVLDEPTSGLDPKERSRLRQLFSQLAEDRTLIISTHIVSDVESIAKEIIMIKDAKIFKSGTPFELVKELEGQIWEGVLPPGDDIDPNEFLIIDKTIYGENYRTRCISDKQPHDHLTEALPSLDDLFIFHYALEGDVDV
jgi:ABC-type multidrug transport system ATPase subunit